MALRGVEGRVANIVRWLERFERAYSSGAIESALMDAECAKADLEDLRNDVWSRVGSKCGRERRRSRVSVTAFSLAAAAAVLTATPVSIKSDRIPEYSHLYVDAVDPARAGEAGGAALSMSSAESVRQPVAAEVRESAAASPPSNELPAGDARQAAVKMTLSASEKTPQPARISAGRGSNPAARDAGKTAMRVAGKPATRAGTPQNDRTPPQSGATVKRAERSAGNPQGVSPGNPQRGSPGNPQRGTQGKPHRGVDADSLPYDKMLSLFQTGSRALKNDEPVISVNRTKGEKNI